MSAEDRLACESERGQLLARADETRAALQVRDVAGSVPLTAIFCGFIQPKAKGAGATAAAGQAAAPLPGAAAAKPPPLKMKVVLVDVRDFASVKMPGCNYNIINANTIELPAYDGKMIKAANVALVKATQDNAKTTGIGGTLTQEQIDAKTEAEEAVKKASQVMTWVKAVQGEMSFVSWFAKGDAASNLRPGSIIKLMGCTGSASIGAKDGKLYTNLQCETPVPQGSTDGAFVSMGMHVDLFQQPIRHGNLATKYGDTFVLYFDDYNRSAADAADQRGPVVRRRLVLSQQTKDWNYGKTEDGELKLIATWSMWQEQEESPGFPKGTYMITATCIEGNWDPEKQQTRNTLRKGFGINSADAFAKIMTANPVPLLATCSVNTEKTQQAITSGNDTTVCLWMDNAHFMLRQYLVTNCAQVTFAYVRNILGVRKDTRDVDASIQRENQNRATQLNRLNTTLKDGRYIFINDKVVNVSAYTGSLWDLQEQGCQWRVMTSAQIDSSQRSRLAALSPTEGEKVLNGAGDAEFILPGEGIIKIIYAVIPMTPEENAAALAACNSWRVRRTQLAARQIAAAVKPEEEGEDNGGVQDMEQDPTQPLSQTATVGLPSVVDIKNDPEEDAAMLAQAAAEEEAAAQQIEEEAAAKAAEAAAAKKKRVREKALANAATSDAPDQKAESPQKKKVVTKKPSASSGATDAVKKTAK